MKFQGKNYLIRWCCSSAGRKDFIILLTILKDR